MFTQVAAEALGYQPDDIVIAEADTARVPNSGPTVASRTVMVVCRLVERACAQLRDELGVATDMSGAELKAIIECWHRDHAEESAEGADGLVAEAEYERPPGAQWDEETYRGDAYGTFA